MKVLIADKFETVGVEKLRAIPTEVYAEAGLKGEALAARLRELDPDVLIVRSCKVPRDVLAAGSRLKLIVRAGSGYDTIDVAAASQRGIMVTNCPGQNAVAVAELTWGLIIALDRRIPENVIDLNAGRWNKSAFAKTARGLKGRTIGIVGSGQIGSEVARRAVAFEMSVLYFNLGRTRRLVDIPTARRVELDDLLRASDVVSIHVPGGPSTNNLIDERRLGLMKREALLINTARANVLDEAALLRALKEGRLRGAAIDVFNDEPAADAKEYHGPVANVPNLYVTHHIGASTEQAQLAVADETVRIVETFKHTGKAPNCVNMREPLSMPMLVVRLHNKPGGLARVFSAIAEEQINVEEMDHVIYDGGKAACAHIRVNKAPSSDLLGRLRGAQENILAVEVIQAE
ncbi:MAG: ACT domain-containing protein [Phycisphaerae bacterium]|jgi:D-3-phosphoglycerate dehydrogenase|nr:ACT domain-containing protein [Phycisphaerae bacterium]MCZ2398951.1 ACT domain-containing protein [Phycisphaerae bacterium]NUQ49792.1 ACT domain-containing protein [Phycisphaerae bacterium]